MKKIRITEETLEGFKIIDKHDVVNTFLCPIASDISEEDYLFIKDAFERFEYAQEILAKHVSQYYGGKTWI